MRIALDIARGLAYLHAENIVHRDIKSMNVLLTEGKACLADFGLARVKTDTQAVSTGSSQAVGTLRWMAPELFSPRAVYTRKSDMYSLGWVLWELASRRIPFHNANSNELILMWVREGEREDIPQDCPARLASVIKDCWHGDPTRRPEAEAVAVLLVSGGVQSNIGAGPSVSVAPPPPPSSPLVKPLEQLTNEELERWLTSIRLQVVIPRLREHDVTAEVLSLCESVQELVEYGVATGHARLLIRRIEEVRGVGVQLSSITSIASARNAPPSPAIPEDPSPSPMGVPTRPPAPSPAIPEDPSPSPMGVQA